METISRVALTFLLNSFWQVPLLAAITWACARVVRNIPARHIHLLWAIALALGLLLPAWSVEGFSAFALFKTPYGQFDPAATAGGPSSGGGFEWLAGLLQNGSRSVSFAPSLASILGGCYLVFLLYRIARLWRAYRKTRRLCRAAVSRTLSPVLESVITNCRAALALPATPVLCSSEVEAPITAGARRPVIILPDTLFASDSAELLTSAMAHEMAHIRRRDFLFNLISELLYLPISFHPAAWLIRRQLTRTREMACDEMVTAGLIEPRAYARALVRIADAMSKLSSPAYTLGIFDDNNLEERIMKIIERRPHASARLARVSLAVATVALVASSLAASAFSLNIGQEKNSQVEGVVGTWQLFPSNDEHPGEPPGPGITIIVAASGNKLRGKAIMEVLINKIDAPGGVKKEYMEWVLIDPQFDGTNFTFKVSPPDKESASTSDYIEGKLKLSGEEFVGRWQSSHGQTGDLRMVRKKD